ncbi:MAG: 5-methyltetrahydropteroyltriglutamate--homocysteine S-methyltransferase [Afipia sp.]|nr:5-methyltetrahydropteroyltriglutamate--homocysteine S-methyltransferase [Afipia sp.]
MSNLSSAPSTPVATLGVPRIGPRRELKIALEKFWSGKIDEAALRKAAADIRAANWTRQRDLGVTVIPSNDFSLYDHVLDTSAMVGAIPKIYGWTDGPVSLDVYFAMARGSQKDVGDHDGCAHDHSHGHGVPAQEMTKWFDTNYHYMVPEFARDQTFALASTKVIDEYREAKALGIQTRPVLVGPVTFLKLGKGESESFDRMSLLPKLLPVYIDVLNTLAAEGADWVQIDEPVLALDLDDKEKTALKTAYSQFALKVPNLKIMLTSYFGPLGDNEALALSLPVAGLHLDLVRGASQLDSVLKKAPADLVLSLGVIDGRNIWRSDLSKTLGRLEAIAAKRAANRLQIAPSCSMLHVPIDLDQEDALDPDLKSWLAFSVQKIGELAALSRVLSLGRDAAKDAFAASDAAAATRASSPKIHNPAVESRAAEKSPGQSERKSPFSERRKLQDKVLGLPSFPTTTIGSFPQTEEVRKARAAHAKGQLSDAEYDAFLRKETEKAVRWQEDIGIDVLVHGEFERNDMVQYFGEQLSGYAFTKHGWVQSYGSRYVRPPIIFGDVSRPKPMTVGWSSYAQSLTKLPMKGMLTGPVTMLQWSFMRDDLGRDQVCRQIAFALRDEVVDLEKAGIGVIQIDEPALREGLPLRKGDWKAYLDWAVECFKISAAGVKDQTQIHTHMCYAEFNDIIDAIGAMDADVISIETSRSKMELLDAFVTYKYPNEIGPGVYDIHSPRVPEVPEMMELIGKARRNIAADQIWINPDCGLKTRGWPEVKSALTNMVEAARQARMG